MRDPNRIEPICDRLKKAWSTVPDWRLGQLFENMRRILAHNGQDIFFMEDEALMQYMEDLFFKGEQL